MTAKTVKEVMGEVIAISRHVFAEPDKMTPAKAEQLRRLITLAEYLALPRIGVGIEQDCPLHSGRSRYHGCTCDKDETPLIPRFDDMNGARCSHEGCDKTWRSPDVCLLNFAPAGFEPRWLCREHHPPLVVEEKAMAEDGSIMVTVHNKVTPVGFMPKIEEKTQ